MLGTETTIASLGGTGKEGKGLAYRWAKSGLRVLIGSRDAAKAQEAADAVNTLLGQSMVRGTTNEDALDGASIAVLTIPYSAHLTFLESFRDRLLGKLLIDVTVPIIPPKFSTVHVPPAGSALLEAMSVLDESTRVVDAFQNISYERLMSDEPVDCDVLVCGARPEDRSLVITLVEAAGMRGWDAGPKENAIVVEGLTNVLVGINRKYGSKVAGIRITGAEHHSGS